jgi:hypothetical protein
MMREMEEMDRVTESYQRTLITLKPKLKNKKLEDLIKGSSDEEEESVEEEQMRRRKKKKTKQEPKRRHKSSSARRRQPQEDEEEEEEEEYREQQFEDTTPSSEQPHRGREPQSRISANDKWKTTKGTTAQPHSVENMSNQNRNMVMLEAEYDPNSKVKTFTSVRPIVVSRKTNLNALFPHLADEIAQEEEQSGGSQAQTPLVEGEIPLKKSTLSGPKTATTPNPLTSISSKKSITPMIISSKPKPALSIPVMPLEQEEEAEEEYTPLQTVTGEDSSPENRNWNMTADSLGSKLAAPNRLQQNTELLMDFAKKRKESQQQQQQQQTMDYTMRSSMGGADSTVAMSVDSLNMTNNKQIPVTTTVARGGDGGSGRNSFANRPLDVHTWTPTSGVNKPAIQYEDQEDRYYEDEEEPIKNRIPLAKTFPPLSSSKIGTQAETSLMTETSILMESFEEGENDNEPQKKRGQGGEMDFTATNEMERDSLMLTHTTLQSTLPTPMTAVQKQQSNRLSIEIEEKPKRNIIIEREYEYEEEEEDQQQDLAEDQSPSPRQFHSSEAKSYPLSANYYASKRTGDNKPLQRSSSFKQSADPFTSSSYLDEDDPFSPQGRPNTSFFPNTNDDQINNNNNNNNNTDDLDIDASQSYTIDFDIAESKPSKHHPQQKAVNIPPPKSPYSRVSSQRTLLEEDSYENSMSSTQKSSPFSTHNNDSTSNLLHDVVGENVSQENEDFVLLGTGKYPTKTNFNLTDSFADRNSHSNNNHDIHGNTMSTNDSSANYSDDFEDGGNNNNNTNTKYSNHRDRNQSQDDDQSNNPLEASSYLEASQEDQDRSYQEQFRSSRNAKNDLNMTPINTSGYSGGGAINQSTELSPVFQGLNQMGDSHSQIGDLSYSSMMVAREESKQQQQSIIPSNTTLQWEKGRAAIDLLELATALEVHISAVRLNSNVSRIVKEVSLKSMFSSFLID